ncbi:MAG: hypothetical protein JRE58_09345 [Deltaproteobacteria bacterium]|nr:hypothetical protein [Deltaproteobacteria bacterium]
MDPVSCLHCVALFIPRNKNQCYCSRSECQRARKAAWQRIKIKTDPDYRATKKLSQQQWVANNPGYWKAYRNRNPEKTERNRLLQTIRNRRRAAPKKSPNIPIAKKDVSNRLDFKPIGQFWMVPLIAKLDVAKVNIYTITNTWP